MVRRIEGRGLRPTARLAGRAASVTGALLAILAGVGAVPLSAQAPAAGAAVEAPSDTFGDPQARSLLARARAARERDVRDIDSYEGLLTERVHVGLTAFRFRRARTLLERERAARIRWTADGGRAIRWLGARMAIPIIGPIARAAGEDADEGAVADEVQREMEAELSETWDVPELALDPWDDRLVFGSDWALHPLADTAGAHYRFRSGDTLRITLPGTGRQVVLAELEVVPRRVDPQLVTASLWFDVDSGALARASYRPARPFDLELDEPEDAEDVPGFLRPITAGIDYVTVEYSLHDFRWWLPRRFALEGEARLGNAVRVPLTVEWRVREYAVNETASEVLPEGGLPPGWTRSERRIEQEGEPARIVTVIVPPADSLRDSRWLSRDLEGPGAGAFSDEEIREIRAELEALDPGGRDRIRPQLVWGLREGLLRYDRVEGLSVGVRARTGWTATTALEATVRLGTADREVRGEASLVRGDAAAGWSPTAYRRLAWSDFDAPFGPGHSLAALVLGSDAHQYFDARGLELSAWRRGTLGSVEGRVFRERHAPLEVNADFAVARLFDGDTARGIVPAEPGWTNGGEISVSRQWGLDPSAPIVVAGLTGAAGRGDLDFQRVHGRLSLTHPLSRRWLVGVEGAAGVAGEDTPVHLRYVLGGVGTLRGVERAALRGTAFWRGTVEVGTRFAAFRPAVFVDSGWAGVLDGAGSRATSVGLGLSFLDGIGRVDVARAVEGPGGWGLHLYLDGLL